MLFKDEIPTGKIAWESPSNIALVKYWGKRAVQLPQNSSLSFTLSKALTNTVMNFTPAIRKTGKVSFFFNGERNEIFEKKTDIYFKSLTSIFPFIKQLDFKIYSKNNFPHSAGIASSASGMSALALCLCNLEQKYFGTLTGEDAFYKKASFVARLGSGSACRSLYGGAVLWGKTGTLPASSDYYGIPVLDVNSVFKNYRDTILIVDDSSKKVSSRIGHALMDNNPYARVRYLQAKGNINLLLETLKNGDIDTFVKIVESEALTLHALMMTSNPWYMLFKPQTIGIIEKVVAFRKSCAVPIAFTLDAGPNIHLLYPEDDEAMVLEFITKELIGFLKNDYFINDKVGKGPERLKL